MSLTDDNGLPSARKTWVFEKMYLRYPLLPGVLHFQSSKTKLVIAVQASSGFR